MSNIITKIPYLLVVFNNELELHEVPLFRGAIIDKVSQDLSLFHNHNDDKLFYRYPLIQYKRVSGKAAIFCVGQGTESVGYFFAQSDFAVNIGDRPDLLTVQSITANHWLLQVWNGEFRYSIRKWLPFNQANYNKYHTEDGIVKKTLQLEHTLIGNILSMCSGLNCHLNQKITCKITGFNDCHSYLYKGVKMQGVDAEFTTNIYLPDYIGVGKGVSLGFGMVKSINDK